MNKQIEEMAKIIAQSVDEETLCDGLAGDSGMACFGCDYSEKEYCKHHLESATGLYNKGYRKSTDVAREVAEQFKEIAKQYLLGKGLYLAVFKNALNHAEAELKKKYESEGSDDFPNCKISGCEAARKDCHIGCPYGKENIL